MSVERYDGGVMERAIAVVGMAGRFPGACDAPTLWQNLLAGTESICRFSPEELLALGRDPAVVTHPRFVGAEGVLDDIESFDAAFFGYSPREAAIMDPQHRLGLEVAWHAFEDAGYDPARCRGPVGVFVSAGISSYLVRHLLPHPDLVDLLGGFSLLIHNDKDFAATTLAHKLQLTGPAVAVGSACSSSLVAVHLATQSLQTYECDMALAGGASLQVPQRQGYLHSGDGIYSPDGRCRPFDEQAAGTVGGSGVAMVLLKRLEDALRDGDRVYAVILGTAVNNDGGASVGYTAPSVDGQLRVIAEAQAVADVSAESIGYVEAHGTGTQLGDAIEVEALSDAFAMSTRRTQYCAVGSIKANLGHLDAAAGVTGLIKAALAVRHGQIPPHPNFRRPNPRIAFEETPFYVNTDLVEWDTDGGPRRAGVSSFGIGGTNAHLVLEEPPQRARSRRPPPPWQVLTVSARSEAALQAATEALAARVRGRPAVEVADVAYTRAARRTFAHRRAVVCRDGDEAAAELTRPAASVISGVCDGGGRTSVFMFPGQGAHHRGMAAELYRDEPTFRGHVDECAELLSDLGLDVRNALASAGDGDPRLADDTVTSQAALFTVEYGLAQTILGWGFEPHALIGHSLGEYAAATVAGALSLDDALRLVVGRARLQEQAPPGLMLAVQLSENELLGWLPDDPSGSGAISLAAVNSPDACVVAGARADLERLAPALEAAGVATRWLPVARAFHSPMMEPLLADFARLARGTHSGTVQRRWISTLTGEWMPQGGTLDPEHWVRHMRQTVRFDTAVRRLLEDEDAVFVEVGPSTTLGSIVRSHPGRASGQVVISCQPHPNHPRPQLATLLASVAQAWAVGCVADLDALCGTEGARRTDCPVYPFQRERHWVAAPVAGQEREAGPRSLDALLPWLERRLREFDGEQPIRGLADYPGLQTGLDELCAALALRYLAAADVDTAPGAVHAVADLSGHLQILPSYQRFLGYFLDLLAEDGILSRAEDGVMFTDGPRPPDPDVVAAALKRRYPEFCGLVDLLLHCGAHYGKALSTAGAALEVLYPEGRGDLLLRTLGEETVEFDATGRLARLIGALVRAVAAAPRLRPLRVLEVGAGGGRLTWEVAGALQGTNAEYVVTDIGRLFLAYLGEEAARRGIEIRTQLFDICRDPQAQGLIGQDFDVIVGLDVVHAAPDVPAALTNLRTLLAPGGLLALVETVAEDRWLSMVWGLSEEWWGFRDDLREHTPLLRPEQWRRAIAAEGFTATGVLQGGASDGADDAVLVLAQAGLGPAAATPAPTPSSLALSGLPEKRPDVAEWCYLPGWRRSAPVVPAGGSAEGGTCLVFTDGALGEAVIAKLRQRGLTVVAVHADSISEFGHESAEESNGGVWRLATQRPEDYSALLDRLCPQAVPPRYVLHLWNVGLPPSGSRLAYQEECQRRGLFSLLSLARAVADSGSAQPVRLLAVTSHAQDVLGSELRAPERSTVQSAVKVIPLEYPQISCSSLDIPVPQPGTADADWLAERVADELFTVPDEAVAAYRHRARWVPSYTHWRLGPPAEKTGPRPGGVYLICGGLGGIGLSLAEYLARLPARVVLVRRTPFPAREEWTDWLTSHPTDEPTSMAIRRLLDAEARGGEVLVLQGDVTSLEDMRAVVSRTADSFGAITGVVHAAGVPDTAGVIHRRSVEDTWTAIAAKVRGPLVLEEVLRDQNPEFVVFCSSIGVVLHKFKFGEVGYVAGNEFLNAYATYRAAHGDTATVTISWTDWLEAGMWAESRKRLAQRYAAGGPEAGIHPTDDILHGLTTVEGIEVFLRVIAHVVGRAVAPHVVISTQDLDALLAVHAAFTHTDHVRALETMRLTPGSRRRPELGTEYVAPRTEAERVAAAIWESLLGVEGIGIHDDFFALGGDSLLALRFLARLQESLGLKRTVAEMFERPTIAGLTSAAEVSSDAQPTYRDGREELVL